MSFLSLGDSYTIGEQVQLSESFPYQTVQRLRAAGIQVYAPEIIAKTGWTTDELNDSIEHTILLQQYRFVTLLIGVNNQYRGRSKEEFRSEFTGLLQKAIQFSGGHAVNVFVLGIPDWGVTKFAEGQDRQKIGKEIDEFNFVCKSVSAELQCKYIDITSAQRADGNNTEFLAPDGLHPSGKEYAKWADLLSTAILSGI